MPAPVFERCADTAPHDSHFWERDGDSMLEGDALRWCEGVPPIDGSGT